MWGIQTAITNLGARVCKIVSRGSNMGHIGLHGFNMVVGGLRKFKKDRGGPRSS